MVETKKDSVRRKNKWTKDEEEALLAGISKYGAGKWTEILDDPDFAVHLFDRNNGNLKDKWRNLKKAVTQTVKSESISISPAMSSSDVTVSNEPSSISSSSKSSSVDSNEPSLDESRYDAIVMEAISTISDEYGSDLSGILSYIEEQYEVPQNFGKLLSDSLRTLVSQRKLEKGVNRYKIPSEVKNKELEKAAEEVARRIAESDNKMFIAAEAVKESQQMDILAEESQVMLRICLDILEKCERGEKVYLKNLFFG